MLNKYEQQQKENIFNKFSTNAICI